MRVLLACLCMLFVSKSNAEDIDITWQVQPVVCVTQRPNTPCQFAVSLQVTNTSQRQYCVFLYQLSEQRLFCSSSQVHQQSLTLTIDNQATLLLKDTWGTTVLSQPLSVKSTQSRTRFRVHSPWSLF